MTTGNIQAIYPLTPTQEGMLFHVIQSPNSGVYVQQLIGELVGELDRDAFTRAWDIIANRHTVLRTLFTWEKRESRYKSSANASNWIGRSKTGRRSTQRNRTRG